MKTLKQIIKHIPVCIGDFSDPESVFSNFQHTPTTEKILFASYGGGAYEGDAWVLYTKDGKLYETHGSHCSCYGLEYQWSEEEVVLKELENRVVNGTFGSGYAHDFKAELKEFLGL